MTPGNMIFSKHVPVSPYLVRPRRPLRKACLETARVRLSGPVQCGTCVLRDMCTPVPRRSPEPQQYPVRKVA